jgi:hypothetical protein
MAISARQATGKPAVTTLRGELIDQAALMGVLNTLYDLGFVLLKVERKAVSELAPEPGPPAEGA